MLPCIFLSSMLWGPAPTNAFTVLFPASPVTSPPMPSKQTGATVDISPRVTQATSSITSVFWEMMQALNTDLTLKPS